MTFTADVVCAQKLTCTLIGPFVPPYLKFAPRDGSLPRLGKRPLALSVRAGVSNLVQKLSSIDNHPLSIVI